MILDDFILSRPGVDTEQGWRIVGHWNAVYPAMRETLGEVIAARREAGWPASEVNKLVRVRRELGQVDRGTHRPHTCVREPHFIPAAALSLVRESLGAFRLGHPRLGDVYRLAAELADASAAHEQALTARNAARGVAT